MRDKTKLARIGRNAKHSAQMVNLPVYRGSTVLFDTVAQLEAAMAARARHEDMPVYGTTGTPSSFALSQALAEMEGGYKCQLYPSGLAAIAGPLMGLLSAGDHLLMPDSVYSPSRAFCDQFLKRFGVRTSYYDPCVGGKISDLLQPNTKVIFLESPGSYTFEVQDVPAIVEQAKKRGILTMMDNTWATPLFFKPLEMGVDVSMQAVTKYVGGHADILMGAATTNEETWPLIRDGAYNLGQCVSGDEAYLALRGMRTMELRLVQQMHSAIKIAQWLMGQDGVAKVLHPALPHDPGHALWKRDFKGAAGLFGLELAQADQKHVDQFIDDLELFGIGFSWGGYESLAIQGRPPRTVKPWTGGPLIRLSIGLEDPDDLIADLKAALTRFNRAR